MSQNSNEVFATVIGCIDGRAVRALDRYAEKTHGVFVDTVTKAGMDKFFCDQNDPSWEELKFDTKISVEKHNSKIVFVHGHDECAGNPVGKEEHFSCIEKGVELVKSWDLGDDVEVIGIWSQRKDEGWVSSVVTKDKMVEAA